MDERKKNWIDMFIKKCMLLKDSKEKLNFYLEWCRNTYNIPEEKLKELEEKYTIQIYIYKMIPVIDKHFSIEDLKKIIKFYSTTAGRKLLNHSFLKDIGKVGNELEIQMEQEFSLNHKKS